jgi:UDP-N-acetylmuramate--alanine ligase
MGRASSAHLIGIGGAGMRSLAQVLLQKGWRLSGSDAAISCDDPLAGAGVHICAGHNAENLQDGVEVVVRSSAIPDDNPEILRAVELQIPVVNYAEMLGLLMQGRRGLAVAGTHGKSSTTAMAAEIFMAAGCDPTFVYGASPIGDGEGGRAGDGQIVLVEACEYRRNFLHLSPHDAVILNVEPDHFDCYPDRESLEDAFCQFAALLPPEGTLLVPWGDGVGWDKIALRAPAHRSVAMMGLRSQARWSHPTIQTFGLANQSDWRAANLQSNRGRYSFNLHHRNLHLARINLAVYGRHNVLNALAAAAMSSINGCPSEAIAAGLANFRGLRRRMECIYHANDLAIWDDYAHHPTEISATLAAIREISPDSRVWCLFQPHQVSRTARLLDELALSLQNAERVLIADIFRAREGPPKAGEATAADLAARTRAAGQDVFGSHAPADIEQYLKSHLAPGDVLVVMGAGDIGKVAHGLMDWFSLTAGVCNAVVERI